MQLDRYGVGPPQGRALPPSSKRGLRCTTVLPSYIRPTFCCLSRSLISSIFARCHVFVKKLSIAPIFSCPFASRRTTLRPCSAQGDRRQEPLAAQLPNLQAPIFAWLNSLLSASIVIGQNWTLQQFFALPLLTTFSLPGKFKAPGTCISFLLETSAHPYAFVVPALRTFPDVTLAG